MTPSTMKTAPASSSVTALLDEAARAAGHGDAAALAVLERDAALLQAPLVVFARGALLQRLGRRAEALWALRDLVAAEPTVPAFAAQLAAVLLDRERGPDAGVDEDEVAEAEAALVTGVRARDPLCLALAARVSSLRGHHQAALHLLDRAIAAVVDDDALAAELATARARAALATQKR
jgi:hypothetical protein